jgi:hypothetical protein
VTLSPHVFSAARGGSRSGSWFDSAFYRFGEGHDAVQREAVIYTRWQAPNRRVKLLDNVKFQVRLKQI